MDAIDRSIVECLVSDGRASLATVGDQVGLSAPAVKRRIDKLVATGVIRQFTAVVDPAVLGWTTEAYVEIFCKGVVAPAELRRSLGRLPEVVEAATITGEADAIVHILTSDVAHLEAAIERIRDEGNVDHTETVIVLSRLVDRGR